MRERSHKRGEVYQQDVKYWLSKSRFLGFDLELFGDAYDVTKKACTIAGIVFDFSLRLCRGSVTRFVLYGESKFRDVRKGNVNTEFKEFLRRAHQAISNGDADDVETAVFLLVSNVPPDDWRKFLRNRSKYCREEISWKANEKPTEQTLEKLGQVVHVLVLSAAIVARD